MPMESLPATSQTSRSAVLATVGATVAFAALRFCGATDYTLFPDEVFSLRVTKASWAQLLPMVARDIVHPPLFYIMLKAWSAVGGYGHLWLRSLPILTSVAALVPFALLCRELGLTRQVATLALLLAAPNPFLIEYAQQIRMYSLLLFFTLWSLWLFTRYSRSESREKAVSLVGLTAANLLLVYTQYYGWVIVGLEVLFLILFDRRRLLPMFLSVAVIAVAFCPWAVMVARVMIKVGGLKRNLGWMHRPDLRDIASFFARLHGSYRSTFRLSPVRVLTGFIVFGVPVALLVGRTCLRPRPGPSKPTTIDPRLVRWLLLFSFGPVLISFGASFVLPQSVYEPRHMLIAVVPYLLLCATAALELRPQVVRIVVVVFMVSWAALGGVELLNRDRVSWGDLVQRVTRSEDCVKASPRGSETLYVIGGSNAIPIQYYLELEDRARVSVCVISNPQSVVGSSAWLAYQESVWGGWTSRRVREELSRSGYRVACDFSSGASWHKGYLLRLEAATDPLRR